MQVDLHGLERHVVGGDVGVDGRVEPHRPDRLGRPPLELGDGLRQELAVELEADRRDVPGLLVAQEVPRPAQLQVAHRDPVAGAELGVVGQRREPVASLLGELAPVGIEQVGVGVRVGPAHPAADLVELGQPERVGPLHDERVRLRDVEPRLDDGGRDQHVEVAVQELHHDVLEPPLGHLPVGNADAQLRHPLADALGRLVDRLDPVVEVERLALAGDLAAQGRGDQLLVELADVGLDRVPAARRRRDDRDVAQPRERHVQRPRDRRRRHREHVHLEPKLAQELLLGDPEALLLVDDHEAQVLGDDVAREHAVRADQHLHLAVAVLLKHALHLGRRPEARHHLDAHREVAEPVLEGGGVLLGQDRRRHEHQHLAPSRGRLEGGPDGDLGLPEADVAAHEPVHRPVGLHVLLHGVDRRLLVVGLLERERALQAGHPLVVGAVRRLGRRLAAGVQGDQLAGQLPHGDPGPRLQGLPGLAAQLRERRRAAVGADVAAHLRELVVRHVQPVVAAELEVEVVADDAAHLLGVEADEPADAVVLMHDVVAGAQVGDGRQGAADAGRAARAAAAEELSRRQDGQPQAGRDEPPPQLADAERDAGLLGPGVPRIGKRGLDPAQLEVRAAGLAEVREAHQHAVARPLEAAKLVLGLGDPERRERRRLRVERQRAGRAASRRARWRRRSARGPPRPGRTRAAGPRGRAGDPPPRRTPRRPRPRAHRDSTPRARLPRPAREAARRAPRGRRPRPPPHPTQHWGLTPLWRSRRRGG